MKKFKILLAAVVTSLACFIGNLPAQTPTPTWPVPGWPEDGSIPLWEGTSYNDSITSTGAERLHAIGIRGQGVSAAVLDSPYDMTNPYINSRIIKEASVVVSLVNGEDAFAFNDKMTKIDTVEFEGKEYDLYIGTGNGSVQLPRTVTAGEYEHGTHVAGTVNAMAPDAGLVLMTAMSWNNETGRTADDINDDLDGSGEGPQTAALLKYVMENAEKYNIVALNGSFGSGMYLVGDEAQAEADNPLLTEAIAGLLESGVIPVFASGNDGYNNYIAAPAALDGGVAVGALHPWGLPASFSDLNKKVVLLAPGENILSAVPPWTNSDGKNLGIDGGTSMAAPHVTGAIVLLASGARNATTDEILQSLIDSGDEVKYDGNVMLPLEFTGYQDDEGFLVACEKFGVDTDEEQTLDTWRQCVVFYLNGEWNGEEDDDVSENVDNWLPGMDPLENLEYRFLRVDKAYMDLTEKRTVALAERVDAVDTGLGDVLNAYAGELGADIAQDTADVFQRLDALDTESQTILARKMSPRFTNAIVESAHIGIVGLHRSFGRRTEMNRIGQGSASSPSLVSCPECAPTLSSGWIEGFGSGFDRKGLTGMGAYDGHFSGTAFGFERSSKGRTLGLFGSWAKHQTDGDGHGKGDWGHIGLYGRLDRRYGFVEGSMAYGFGDYDMKRRIFIPGAVFEGYEEIVLDPMSKEASASADARGFSFRLAGGRDLWMVGDWIVGPRAELALSHIQFDGYTEQGADSLNLAVNRYKTTYMEGGLGLYAGKSFLVGTQKFVATGKLMGMYGGGMGGDLFGRFSEHGNEFRIDTNKISTLWCVPEATLAWNVSQGIVLSGSYYGRFGEKYSENAGSIALHLYW